MGESELVVKGIGNSRPVRVVSHVSIPITSSPCPGQCWVLARDHQVSAAFVVHGAYAARAFHPLPLGRMGLRVGRGLSFAGAHPPATQSGASHITPA